MKIILTDATGFVGEGVMGQGNTLLQVGRSMINATANGYEKAAIEVKDIDILSK